MMRSSSIINSSSMVMVTRCMVASSYSFIVARMERSEIREPCVTLKIFDGKGKPGFRFASSGLRDQCYVANARTPKADPPGPRSGRAALTDAGVDGGARADRNETVRGKPRQGQIAPHLRHRIRRFCERPRWNSK